MHEPTTRILRCTAGNGHGGFQRFHAIEPLLTLQDGGMSIQGIRSRLFSDLKDEPVASTLLRSFISVQLSNFYFDHLI